MITPQEFWIKDYYRAFLKLGYQVKIENNKPYSRWTILKIPWTIVSGYCCDYEFITSVAVNRKLF